MFIVYLYLQMDGLQFSTTLTYANVTPTVLSSSAVYCPLPDVSTYVVEVTYDQTTFTDPVNVLVYDACCYTCDGNTLACSIAVSILMARHKFDKPTNGCWPCTLIITVFGRIMILK